MVKTDKIASRRVALYARVSTEEQAGEDHFSIDAQFAEMRETAQKKGWDVVGEFVDEGFSGTKRTRPQLEAAFMLARSRGFDILMVHELSRLSRSVYHTLDIFDSLGKMGVGFASVRDPDFDFSDPSKRLFLTILAAINEYYITALSHHTKKAKRERTRQGLYNASSMPYGYKNSGDKRIPAVINPDEAGVVQFAFENYSTGHFSDQEIAELLNAQGHRTHSGRRFSKDTISGMLSNPFYVGKASYRDGSTGITEIYDGLHEPIISKEVWEKVQDVRTSRRTLSRAVQKNYRGYLLSNLAVCDVCGRTLRAQGAESGQYYREMSYQRGYIDCPHQNMGIRAEILENQINILIRNIQLPSDWLTEVTNQVKDDEQLVELSRQRDRLEAERHRLRQMRIEGDFDDSLDDYRAEMDRIRREIDTLPTYDQIETIRITGQAIENLYQVWETATKEDQRDILRLILREVRVDVPSGRVTSIFPLAAFLSIFRKIPILAEHEFGEFIPLWDTTQIEAIPNLQQLSSWVSESVLPSPTLPFFDSKQLLPPPTQRSARGIANALHKLRKSPDFPQLDVVQIVTESQPPLPMDLRKWPEAKGENLSINDFILRPRKSMSVVVSQYMLWENPIQGGKLAPDLLAEVKKHLQPGGIWYFIEMLPLDFPSHWLYRSLPSAWQWAKINTWTVYNLYNQLLGYGFNTEIKRQAFYQPISALAAQDVLRAYPGFTQGLTDNAVEHAIERLSTLNSNVMLSSEFTIIEGWAVNTD